MKPISSFAPIADSSATILILGSIPSIASLEANQYYAHPRNAFWPIMGAIYAFDATLSYELRQKALRSAGVAVWDVLQTCVRTGSLDRSIQTGSRIPNHFPAFFKRHPHIHLIAFNGNEAERYFRKIVMPTLNLDEVKLLKLPSSSPAHTMPFKEKLAAWKAIKL
ncbi:MAG: DNA-deoxyinosine glycosylase [Methylotenera sp.]|jgi:double-stranded uracil-DNA glycosylase